MLTKAFLANMLKYAKYVAHRGDAIRVLIVRTQDCGAQRRPLGPATKPQT